MNITHEQYIGICNIIWPWLKSSYVVILNNSNKDNISFTISFNKTTIFHYMIDSIDIVIKEIKSNNPELKIKTHAPYFSPEMKTTFQLNKVTLKETALLIKEYLDIK